MGFPKGPEGQGLPEVETREDEEQNVKLTEILELLVAAGYFRARIKGLSPFDKVVGGMTWCITTCSFDVDVDLLFQENSTIGQKIALSEKIVSVLPRMKCPHQLEPHQIQGMDFIHIFPVIQWLVKRAIETKEEMGDYIRSYSVSQFQKTYSLPEDDDFIKRKEKAIQTVVDISDVYKPCRKYRRQRGAEELLDEESRIHATLLEYGRVTDSLTNPDPSTAIPSVFLLVSSLDKRRYSESLKAVFPRRSTVLSGFQASIPASSLYYMTACFRLGNSSLGAQEGGWEGCCPPGSDPGQAGQQEVPATCGHHISCCISSLLRQGPYVGVEAQSELSAEDSPEKLGASQLHHRKIISLNKQIRSQGALPGLLVVPYTDPNPADQPFLRPLTPEALTVLKSYSEKLDKEQAALEKIESKADPSILQNLRALVAMNENLKSQEQEFKAHCRADSFHPDPEFVCWLNLRWFSFRAMASPASRDQFLRQMEQIVEGIKQSRMKVRWPLCLAPKS
ncbi:coiled-coil domain-containing protein 93 [Trichechus manatus latirostris]|uniref:Coiled-coil domain-containing protein 93 n=1 Tax=Trichechus manatus latirostris TaxID=127582 RepID=A0A2Y9QMP0_TRIMA|nr:coiled-coil domain-containing protein 93 [Trichechus manatus latirostris]